MSFKPIAAIKCVLACATKFASAFRPSVFHALEPDIARIAREAVGNRVRAISVLRAIHAAPRQQAGEIRDSNAEDLLGQNMIHAVVKIRNLGRKTLGQAPGDLAKEHTGLCAWVEKLNGAICPEVRTSIVRRPSLGKRVKHPISELRWREHLVVGKIGYAGQNIRVASAKREACLTVHMASSKPSWEGEQASSRTVIGG